MRVVKYVLFLFLFLLVSCKVLDKNKLEDVKPVPPPVEQKDSLVEGVLDYVTSSDIKRDVTQDEVDRIIKQNGKHHTEKKSVKRNKTKKQEVIQDPQYTEGLIAYKVPKEMTVGNSYLVKIRITKENNKTMLVVGDRKIPIADDVDNSVVEVEDINVSPIMSANLIVSKNSFRIDTLSTEYQNISKRGYTEWAWNIVPLKGGNNLLKLNVKIRIKEDGETYYKDIVVFDKKINIKSNIKFSIITWISEYWQWLFATILIPLIKWLYDEWKKRKEESK